MKQLYAFLFLLIFISGFAQFNVSQKMESLYSRLNNLKQETRNTEKELNSIEYENMSNSWIQRKDFILRTSKIALEAMESRIGMIQHVKLDSDKVTFCYKIENGMNEYIENLRSYKESLINDIKANIVIITKNNLSTVEFDDLLHFLLEHNKSSSEKLMRSVYEQDPAKYGSFRRYLEALAVAQYLVK